MIQICYEKLRYERKLRKITCEKMSELIGLRSKSTYSKKEKGVIPFSLIESKIIADFFETTVDSLFFGKIEA